MFIVSLEFVFRHLFEVEMDKNLLKKINDCKKVYHPILCGENQVIFDYEHLTIIKSNNVLEEILQNENINEAFIHHLAKIYGEDTVNKSLLQINTMIDNEIVFKNKFSNQAKEDIDNSNFIHAELSFATVHKCNLNCGYCFASAGKNFCKDHNNIIFTKECMKKSLDYFVFKYAPRAKYYRIDFVGGGEPLLNFDIIEDTYNYAKSLEQKIAKPIKIWICTNGTAFNTSILDKINEMNLSIGISIDGDEKNHDFVRRYANGQGTYKNVMNWVKHIQSEKKYSKKLKDIWVLSVIHSLNLNVLDILKHHVNNGITTVQMKPVRLKQ